MRRLRPLVLVALLAAAAPPARAQTDGPPTNAEVFGALTLECLAPLPDSVRSFRLALDAALPFVRPALVARWNAEGRTVYAGDTTAAAVPTLRVAARDVRVAYARAGRGRADRTVTLALDWTLVGPDGRLLADRSCRERTTDAVPRADLAGLADPAYGATQADLPPGRVRRYVAPVVFAAATVVSVALFFSLRSGG